MDLPQIRLKIVLLGAANVGKTSLLLRFTANNFLESTVPSLGYNVMYKTLELNG